MGSRPRTKAGTHLRIQNRLTFSFLLVAAVSGLIAGGFLHHAIGIHLADQIAERLNQDARMARDLYRSDPDPEIHADALADRLGADLAVRLTFVDASGRVLGDSELDGEALERVENHRNRPEILAALQAGQGRATRHSTTLSEDMLYVALRIEDQNPSRGIVRAAVPLTAVRTAQQEIRLPLAAAALLSVAAALLLGWLAARRPARRLEEMSLAASEIAAGNTAARVAPEGQDEIARLGRSLNRMAKQLADRLALLSRDRNQLVELLDSMVEGVLLTDGSGRILLANRAFERIFGASPPLQGLRPLEAARVPALQDAVEAALRTDGPATREIALSGFGEKVLQASLAAVREDSRTVGAVLVFHDVTELKKLEKVRREFVANVSHELRTPLTAIRGYAETLRDGAIEDPAQVSEFAEVIHRHAHRLQALIEDLLDLSSIEQGKARMEVARFPLREAVLQAEAVVRPVAQSKGQQFSVLLPQDLPHVRADRDRLAQVLINLLENAVKFTPEGGSIFLSARTDDDRVVIRVRDTGPGIPSEELPRIFERFYRVDRSRDRKEGGTGLGLAIAKHLTQAMGGHIEVETSSGSGTTFRLTLPSG